MSQRTLIPILAFLIIIGGFLGLRELVLHQSRGVRVLAVPRGDQENPTDDICEAQQQPANGHAHAAAGRVLNRADGNATQDDRDHGSEPQAQRATSQ